MMRPEKIIRLFVSEDYSRDDPPDMFDLIGAIFKVMLCLGVAALVLLTVGYLAVAFS